jgi:RNA-directed DNA polymerase
VSAGRASPAAKGSRVVRDLVRALQHALYRAAKADPGRRFHALWDKVSRSDVLWRAWVAVRSNKGAPGIDKTTLAAVEEYGITRLLDELASELRERPYRPLPARRVLIPKPGTAERRPLSIPAVRDRVVQAAAKIVLEPVFEADFLVKASRFGSASFCTLVVVDRQVGEHGPKDRYGALAIAGVADAVQCGRPAPSLRR